jgi:hypothetical protein
MGLFRSEVRTGQKSQAANIVERRSGFFPFDAGIFDPKAGVVMLAPVGHPADVEELNTKVERAHPGIFLHVSDEFVLKAVRVALS